VGISRLAMGFAVGEAAPAGAMIGAGVAAVAARAIRGNKPGVDRQLGSDMRAESSSGKQALFVSGR
jgi:hypothetical protein